MTLRNAAISRGWVPDATIESRATDASASLTVGIDIGGTKIHAASYDATSDRLLEARRATDPSGGRAVLDQVTEVVAELAGGRRADAVVVGLPGVVDPRTHCLSEAPNLPGWDGFDVAAALAEACGAPVTVENDVNLAAWGEHAWTGLADLAFVAVGTGIGVGQVAGGRIVRGPDGAAGEVHDLPVGPDRVDLEAVVSGPALARAYRERTGTTASPAQILAATTTDLAARAAVDTLVDALSDLVHTIHRLTSPGAVVLGGGLGSRPGIARAVIGRLDARGGRRPVVRPSVLGSHAATYGALDLGRGPGR